MIAISSRYVLLLFRRGKDGKPMDTFDIARHLGLGEAAVTRLLTQARDEERRAAGRAA